jgi:hypothetical protein
MARITKTTIKKFFTENNITDVEIRGASASLEVEFAKVKDSRKFQKTFPWGGYTTGYGAIVLRADYRDKGDYNDKSSAWHY